MRETHTRGVWEIEDTVSEDQGTEQHTDSTGRSYGVHGVMMHMGGQPHLRARNEAIASLFTETPAPVEGKQTVLTIGDSGSVTAYEGRKIVHQGREFLLRKGTQRSGYYLDRMAPLEIVAGYSPKNAHLAWLAKQISVPELSKFSLDGIPERVEDEDGIAEVYPQIAAVFIGTHPGFGLKAEGRAAGCMWLVLDKQSPEESETETILNGYFWCPDGADLTSEHGSIYASQLERWAGRVKDFTPGGLNFRECVMDELPTDRIEAYRRVLAYKPATVSV